MKLFTGKYVFKASISHVFRGYENIGSVYNESIQFESERKRIKIILKKDGLVINRGGDLLKIIEVENRAPALLTFEIYPIPDQLKKFGSLKVSNEFEGDSLSTIVKSTVESSQKPGIIWIPIIKLIVFVLLFQSRGMKKKFISAIENHE